MTHDLTDITPVSTWMQPGVFARLTLTQLPTAGVRRRFVLVGTMPGGRIVTSHGWFDTTAPPEALNTQLAHAVRRLIGRAPK